MDGTLVERLTFLKKKFRLFALLATRPVRSIDGGQVNFMQVVRIVPTFNVIASFLHIIRYSGCARRMGVRLMRGLRCAARRRGLGTACSGGYGWGDGEVNGVTKKALYKYRALKKDTMLN